MKRDKEDKEDFEDTVMIQTDRKFPMFEETILSFDASMHRAHPVPVVKKV